MPRSEEASGTSQSPNDSGGTKMLNMQTLDHTKQLTDAEKADFEEACKKLKSEHESSALSTPSETYTLNVQSALSFMITKESELGGGIIGDSVGYDKIRLMAAMTEMGFMYQDVRANRRGESSPSKPTLIVVAEGLTAKTQHKMQTGLGEDWRVFRYGHDVRPYANIFKIELEPDNVVFKSSFFRVTAGRHAVVTSFNDLWKFHDDHPDLSILDGLFERIIIDDRGGLKQNSKACEVLRAMKACCVWILTYDSIGQNLITVRDYVALLEKDGWADIKNDNLEWDGDLTTQQNPYTADQASNKLCLTTAAFDAFILPLLTAADNTPGSTSDHLTTARGYLDIMYKACALLRSKETLYKLPDGTVRKIDPDTKPVHLPRKVISYDAKERVLFNSARAYVREQENSASSSFRNTYSISIRETYSATYMSLISDHLALSEIDKSEQLKRDLHGKDLDFHVWAMRDENLLGICDRFPTEPKYGQSDPESIRQFTFGSPKFRYAMNNVRKIIRGDTDSKKVIVLTVHKAIAELFSKALTKTKVRHVLLTDAVFSEDDTKTEQFCNDPKRCRVLVATFDCLVGLADHGLYKYCSNVLCLDDPQAYMPIDEAVRCVHHPEQKYEQTVMTYYLEDLDEPLRE